jgi:dsDNA-binding SOS-regulon protein
MSGIASMALTQALELTSQMLAAAEDDQWSRVIELESERQKWLRPPLAVEQAQRGALAILAERNRRLLERATAAQAEIGRQLEQHKYNHRALNIYIASSG